MAKVGLSKLVSARAGFSELQLARATVEDAIIGSSFV